MNRLSPFIALCLLAVLVAGTSAGAQQENTDMAVIAANRMAGGIGTTQEDADGTEFRGRCISAPRTKQFGG